MRSTLAEVAGIDKWLISGVTAAWQRKMHHQHPIITILARVLGRAKSVTRISRRSYDIATHSYKFLNKHAGDDEMRRAGDAVFPASGRRLLARNAPEAAVSTMKAISQSRGSALSRLVTNARR